VRFSIYPWDIKSWRSAFRITGVPGVALFFLLMGAMLQIGDTSGTGAGHASAAAIILIRTPAILIAFILVLVRPRIAIVSVSDLRFVYGAFAALYLISTLWSHFRVQTMGKGAELMLAGLVFFEASESDQPLLRIEGLRRIALLTMSTLGMVAALGFAARIPSFVQARVGLFTSTTASAPFLSGNGLGYVASALFLVVFAEWQGRRMHFATAIGQLLFALALFSVSASRTSFVILLLTILLVVCKRSKLVGALVVCGAALICCIFWTQLLQVLQGNQSASSFTTLSGRTVVWDAAVNQFKEHPLLGVGGGIGGKVVIANIGNQYLEEMSSLHNGFLEVLTGLGLVGFAVGMYMLVLTTWRTLQSWNSNPEFVGTYVLIIHVWMTTFMSTGILGWMGYEVVLFLCILTNVDLVAERARALTRAQLRPVRWPAGALIPGNQQSAGSFLLH
jgi:O-antigen ligase